MPGTGVPWYMYQGTCGGTRYPCTWYSHHRTPITATSGTRGTGYPGTWYPVLVPDTQVYPVPGYRVLGTGVPWETLYYLYPDFFAARDLSEIQHRLVGNHVRLLVLLTLVRIPKKTSIFGGVFHKYCFIYPGTRCFFFLHKYCFVRPCTWYLVPGGPGYQVP